MSSHAALSVVQMQVVLEGGVCACRGLCLLWLPRFSACVFVLPHHSIALLLCLTLCAVHSLTQYVLNYVNIYVTFTKAFAAGLHGLN